VEETEVRRAGSDILPTLTREKHKLTSVFLLRSPAFLTLTALTAPLTGERRSETAAGVLCLL
jgi:hypothetical protein